MLFFMTMKQQIKVGCHQRMTCVVRGSLEFRCYCPSQHMIKHKYIPFSWGKQTYGDITRHGSGKKKPNAFGKRSGVSFPSLHVKSAALTS